MIINPFDALTAEEKAEFADQLRDLAATLEDKKQHLLAHEPKWWQFWKKKAYRKACIQWCSVAQSYNTLKYWFDCSNVFQD